MYFKLLLDVCLNHFTDASISVYFACPLQAVVRACEPGDTLIFYFCGHGVWDFRTDRHFFANYDADGDSNDNSFDMCELYAELNASFRGATVLLLADCCYSGMTAMSNL